MNTEKSYELVLEYDYFPMEVNPRKYLNTGKLKYLKEYRELTARHLAALFANLKEQNDGSWNAKILAVSTCKQDKDIDQYYECDHTLGLEYYYRIDNREELHIHVLVSGQNCAEIVKCIERYWADNFGDAEDTSLEYSSSPSIGEWVRYFNSRETIWHLEIFTVLLQKQYWRNTDNTGFFGSRKYKNIVMFLIRGERSM